MKAETANPKTVLIVDDDDDIRSLLVSQITMMGHTSLSASNGRECLDMLKSEKPDLIIMDIRMPLMDGITTLKHLQANNQSVPAIIYSGFLDDDSIKLADSLGAKRAYSKPITQSDLQHAIDHFAL